MIGYNQVYNANDRIQLFQGFLGSINWTLGDNALTESELLILSYLLYYNDKYRSITDEETRNELLFSTSVKKKIKEEFKVDSQKLETYLNKLRKKGVITANNTISPKFIIYPEDKVFISFTFQLKNNVQPQTISSPQLDTQVQEPIVYNEVSTEVTTENQEEVVIPANTGNLWDKYMEEDPKKKIVSWNSGLDD